MDEAELKAFLGASPAPTAAIATTGEDGQPHAAPVWFALDGLGNLMFNTGEATIKGRNLRRDPRIAVCVDDPAPPFAFAVIRATVELIDELTEVRRWATIIGGRYMGQDQAERYGERNGVPGELLVKVPLTRVSAFSQLSD
jgi:PPOX class probable F420-dependent enzyme